LLVDAFRLTRCDSRRQRETIDAAPLIFCRDAPFAAAAQPRISVTSVKFFEDAGWYTVCMSMELNLPKSVQRAERQRRTLENATRTLIRLRRKRVSVADLASAAHYSPSHLRALYRQIQCEAVGRAEKRLRLDRAAFMLRHMRASVRDVAQAAGYASIEAFSRAFFKHYGVSPGRFAKGEPPQVPKANAVTLGMALAYASNSKATA
jgi:AraC-like DNA-binding protein